MRIRNYEADAPFIARLFYETVRTINRKDYTEEQLGAWASKVPDPEAWHRRSSNRCTQVADKNGEVIGFGELEYDGHLDMLYCRKDAIGRDVGRRLYLALEREARNLRLERVFAEVSITARSFFERRGFSVIAPQTVVRQGVSMINFRMEKWLR